MDLADFFDANGWRIVRDTQLPAIPPQFVTCYDLPLSILARRILNQYKQGIYVHQKTAIQAVMSGENVCLTTATSSGKSLVFYACGTELLARRPNGTVLAIYPLRALTDEQELKWSESVANIGADIQVGRIDGSVPQEKRMKIMRDASVLIMTPDVIHAWLLSNLHEHAVRDFFEKLQLIVIDEAHTYTGVFGSNSAYLFRRIHRICNRLGASPRYIAASATINNPLKHMQLLTGKSFRLIDRDADSSGHKARRIIMVEPPADKDVLTNLSEIMHFAVDNTEHQFITFVDSRKQTEQLASVMRRGMDTADNENLDFDILKRLHVFPFRAGYESADRKHIQDQLRKRLVRGVISTSALEMGIDLPWLTLGILFGIPYSATSYYQRIGRVGRHADGVIIIVNDGSILSNRIFRNPELLDTMPLAEGALYLENPRVQYIHAMCLARPGGEDDAVTAMGVAELGFADDASVPEAFVRLCNQEHVGEISQEFQPMKAEAGTDPNHVYPLRDCEAQYKVKTLARNGPERSLGSLSFSQMMREAYPGAVYYYQTEPFRVVRILFREHLIQVRHEKRYTTKPSSLPILIYPNLTTGNVYSAQRYAELFVIECNLQLKEIITGYKERRGPNEHIQSYPLDPNLGYYFNQSRFERNYFSSGVLLSHPLLERSTLDRETLAQILFEAYLMQLPFERQDVRFGSDRYRVSRGSVSEGQRFLCVFDQTYGSLRLTARLTEPAVLRGVLDKAVDIARNDKAFEVSSDMVTVLETLCDAASSTPMDELVAEEPPVVTTNATVVIVPGSTGIYPDYHNEEFLIEGIIYTPKGLVYRGRRRSQTGRKFEEVLITAPHDKIVPIDGASTLGYYDYDTAEITPCA